MTDLRALLTRAGEALRRWIRSTSIKLIIAWYDLWIGAFWDRQKRKLYIFLIPCIGLVISFPLPPPPAERKE